MVRPVPAFPRRHLHVAIGVTPPAYRGTFRTAR